MGIFCTECGKTNKDTAKVCEHCGTTISENTIRFTKNEKINSQKKVSDNNNYVEPTENLIKSVSSLILGTHHIIESTVQGKTPSDMPIKKLDLLIYDLKSSNKDKRHKAENKIVSMGSDAFDDVVKLTKSENSVLRRKACEILGRMHDPRGVVYLNKLIKDSSTNVRRRAANALIQNGNKKSLPYLHAATGDSSDVVRKRVAIALGNIGDESSILPLGFLLDDKYEDVRNKATEALKKFGPKGEKVIYQHQEKLLADEEKRKEKEIKRQKLEKQERAKKEKFDSEIKSMYHGTFNEYTQEHVDFLVKRLYNFSRSYREAAFKVLVNLGAPAVGFIIKNLYDSNGKLHKRVARVLQENVENNYKKVFGNYFYCSIANEHLIEDVVEYTLTYWFTDLRNEKEDKRVNELLKILPNFPIDYINLYKQSLKSDNPKVRIKAIMAIEKSDNYLFYPAIYNMGDYDPDENVRKFIEIIRSKNYTNENYRIEPFCCQLLDCAKCIDICPVNVFRIKDVDTLRIKGKYIYDNESKFKFCTLCRQCENICPENKIKIEWDDYEYDWEIAKRVKEREEREKADYLARRIASEIDRLDNSQPSESYMDRNRRLAQRLIDENDFFYMDDINAMPNHKH